MREPLPLWRAYFGLATLESLAVLCGLASEWNAAALAGPWKFSLGRWILLTAVGLIGAAFAALSIRPPETTLGARPSHTTLAGILLACAAISFGAVALQFLIPASRLGRWAGYLGEVGPLLLWTAAMGIQTAVAAWIYGGFRLRWDRLQKHRPLLVRTSVFLGVLGAIALFFAWSRIGLAPDAYGWNAPGTPILFPQVLFACLMAGLAVLFSRRLGNRRDILICTALWLCAALLWANAPMRPTFFSPRPGPPNFESYPFSDSAYYDIASQIILNGKSIGLGLLRKPLYDFFVAFLHLFAGMNYGLLINLQVMILAAIPVLMYLLAARLGGRLAGLIASLLVILREYNSILLANIIEVSSVRLLLSDMPSMLLMLLAALLMVHWFSSKDAGWRLPAVTGAALGLLILIRTQTMALVPVLLAAALFIYWRRWKLFFSGAASLLAGVALILAPWVGRNYLVSGQVSIEDTGSYMQMMAGNFLDDPALTAPLPGESSADYDARLRAVVLRGLLSHPDRILGYTSAHFMHNEVQSFLHLPQRAQFETPRAYVDGLPFWRNWTGTWPASMFLFVVLNLTLLALGMARAWSRVGAVSLTPVFLSLGYALTVALARFSGWRYILPADWVVILFYSLGLAQALQLARVLFQDVLPKVQAMPRTEALGIGVPGQRGLLIAMLISGLSLTVAEQLIPERYPALDRAGMIELYQQLAAGRTDLPPAASVAEFLEHSEAAAFYGVAAYPRFFERGEGVAESTWTAYTIREYDRLGFLLLDTNWAQIVVALPESPLEFPHDEEVLVIGCLSDDHVDALLILPAAGAQVFASSPEPQLSCPAIPVP